MGSGRAHLVPSEGGAGGGGRGLGHDALRGGVEGVGGKGAGGMERRGLRGR